jgi:hypothetical protein
LRKVDALFRHIFPLSLLQGQNTIALVEVQEEEDLGRQ